MTNKLLMKNGFVQNSKVVWSTLSSDPLLFAKHIFLMQTENTPGQIPSGSLTQPLKMDKFIAGLTFKMVIIHSYVSLPEGTWWYLAHSLRGNFGSHSQVPRWYTYPRQPVPSIQFCYAEDMEKRGIHPSSRRFPPIFSQLLLVVKCSQILGFITV